ncbi:MAG: hypothetical protein CVU00_08195 [Bacteroidetes bacterium HGW-Bacteroidetes-17]|jgi:polyferredoxin|nr:MAG: hypothetical protein CVU00_08195 [Bacteroidetes bacterium HGW-Bacteroidetes-17]
MKKIKTNPYRLTIQLIIFALLSYMGIKLLTTPDYLADFEAYCPFGGIQAFTSFLVSNTLACTMTSAQIAMGLIFLLAIILFSKLFCSFICPIGSISEWLGKIGDKFKIRFTITGVTDKILRSLKYGLLFITVYFTVESSELFCKWFCPYYAVASGFNPDVNVIMAVGAILFVIIGSIFIRLLWCKYLCPLGALSNIFRYFILTVSILGIYLLLNAYVINISFIWPLAFLCGIAYIFEIYTMQSRIFPLLKVKRDAKICTSCKLCDKVCPQAIQVSKETVIKHIDCHLCADCLHVCPEKGALKINGKGRKWWPAIIVVILIIAGLIIGKSFELPTLSEYWAEPETKSQMEIYTIHDLKTVKCYGSSVAFSNRMYDMDGVYGIATYVSTFKVKIWYAPDMTDTLKIREWIFTPAKVQLQEIDLNEDNLIVYKIRVDNFLDQLDTENLKGLLAEQADIIGMQTEFGCPVYLTLYVKSNAQLTEENLKNIIEQRGLWSNSKSSIGAEYLNYHFKVVEVAKLDKVVSVEDVVRLFTIE